MVDGKSLVEKFKAAGLELQMLDRSIGLGNRQIFQLDIKRDAKGTHRREWYACWPGTAEGVEAQVLDTDKKKCQLLLMVKEGKAKFFRYKVQPKALITNAKGNLPKGVKIVKRHPNGSVDIQEETTGKTRKYLVGRDERMLFMCEVKSNVTNMRTALDSLKSTITTAEGKNVDFKRQGEWLMLRATKAETAAIETVLKKDPSRLHKKVDIALLVEGRSARKPHVASEAVTVPPPPAAKDYAYSVRGRDDVFIRGTVKHSDHPTKRLPVGVWHKVIRNNEVRDIAAGGMFRGSTYID